VAGLDYYETAMQKIEGLVDKPLYYLFSDDGAWAKEHLVKNRKDIVVVTHNSGKDSWQDMYLMSKCQHHIIANSSFSWWGAWLNADKKKVVISPKIWFANTEKNEQTQDLIPQSWIRI
jgi:Glycosyl transferase family 11